MLAVIALVRKRDQHQCVRCGREGALTTQHRVARGMGGSRHRPWVNQPSNLVSLCGSGTTGCHGWVESNPIPAKSAGWAVSQYQTPEDVPVLYPDGGYYFLDDAGNKHELAAFPPGSCGHAGGGGRGGGQPGHDPGVGSPWAPVPDWPEGAQDVV
jgi:hypothetical protein